MFGRNNENALGTRLLAATVRAVNEEGFGRVTSGASAVQVAAALVAIGVTFRWEKGIGEYHFHRIGPVVEVGRK